MNIYQTPYSLQDRDRVHSTVVWCIVDTATSAYTGNAHNTDLQALMAEKLSLPLEIIQSVWLSVCLVEARLMTFPGAGKLATPEIIRREIANIDSQVTDLKSAYVILLTDEDDGSPAVIGQLAGSLGALTHKEPTVVSVRRGELLAWQVADETVIDHIMERLWDS